MTDSAGLAALGLDHDATERDIRRAYAQRLKRIDQDADIDGFQRLRDDYERALRWVERRETGAAAAIDALAPAPTMQDLAPDEVEVEVVDLPARTIDTGAAVFAAFAARIAASPHGADDVDAALAAALADPRLNELEAHAGFEWRVARRLADGWRPGHEHLFDAAFRQFHWDQDRSRLAALGPPGAVLDRAFSQGLLYRNQSAPFAEVRMRLLDRLRGDEAPSEAQLLGQLELLDEAVQRFPDLFAVLSSMDNVRRWRELHAVVGAKVARQAAEIAAAARTGRTTRPATDREAPQPTILGTAVAILSGVAGLGALLGMVLRACSAVVG